ncbi:MAG: hypothetical protein WBC44_00980 [Planctomycetaceae bacterium]
MATQVQIAVVNALESLGLKKDSSTGPPGSPQPVTVTPDTIAYINSVEGTTFEVNAEGQVNQGS